MVAAEGDFVTSAFILALFGYLFSPCILLLNVFSSSGDEARIFFCPKQRMYAFSYLATCWSLVIVWCVAFIN